MKKSFVAGSPKEVAQVMQEFVDAGATWVSAFDVMPRSSTARRGGGGGGSAGPGLPASKAQNRIRNSRHSDRGRDSSCGRMSHCRVDADGVPAEWVEATVATDGQPTLVYFLGDGRARVALEQARPIAERLAAVTGARILTVACLAGAQRSRAAAVDAGLTAYGWLLCEGCDVDVTTFVSGPSNRAVVMAILNAARTHRLPLPASAALVEEGSSCCLQPAESHDAEGAPMTITLVRNGDERVRSSQPGLGRARFAGHRR